MDYFTRHPSTVCMSYGKHAWFSLRLSGIFFKSAIQAIIHSIFPLMFIKSSTSNTRHIMKWIENNGCKRGHTIDWTIVFAIYLLIGNKVSNQICPTHIESIKITL
jgi:hypothetical protein